MASLRRPVVWVSGVAIGCLLSGRWAADRSSGSGDCAACGWSGPAYTFSLVSIWRPSGPFGQHALDGAADGVAGLRASSSP